MYKKMQSKLWLWVITLALAVPMGLEAQQVAAPSVTREDYARADQFEGAPLLRNLKNGLVIPQWIGQSDEFWYRRETAAGYEFVIVDAATGRKRLAFDHGALAQALTPITGSAVSAERLPFLSIAFNESRDSIHISIKDKDYDCQLAPARCAIGKIPRAAPEEINFLNANLPPVPYEGVLLSPDQQWGVTSKEGNLYLKNMHPGEERALTHDGQPDCGYGIYPGGWGPAAVARERAIAAGHSLLPMRSYWSPDSRTVIVTHTDQRHVAEYPMLETVPGDGSFRPKLHVFRLPLVGEVPPKLEWYAFDIPSGKSRRLDLPYDKLLVPQQDILALRKTWWSADNRHLYAAASGPDMEAAYFFDADIASGQVRTVIEEHMHPRMDLNSASYNPPNVYITKDGKDIIWFSERDGWGHLYLYDAQTGQLKNQITKGDWLVRDLIDIDESRKVIFFTGAGREGGNPYYRYLYRVNFDGTGLTLLSPEHTDHALTSPANEMGALEGAQGYQVLSPSRKYVVYNYSTPQTPGGTVIRTADGKLVSEFEKMDASALFAQGYHPPEEFVAKAADGKSELWSLVYKPSHFDPTKHYPVVDLEYASPMTAVVPRNFRQGLIGVPSPAPGPSALAELGFIVVAIDARSTTYRSREFSQANYGKLNINGLDDHVAVIKQLGDRFPYVDTTRVGIMGASYGGWSAFRGMLEFPDFYKVGVSGSPMGSMQNQYPGYHLFAFQGAPVYSNGTHMRPTPSEVAENYNAVDGRQQASRLKGHLLVIMAELDENCLPATTLQLLDAFIKADKDFDLIYLPNHNHVDGYGPYTTRRIKDYFVRYLAGGTPPESQ